MAPPVFKTGLAANIVAGGFDSLPPPPSKWIGGHADAGTYTGRGKNRSDAQEQK